MVVRMHKYASDVCGLARKISVEKEHRRTLREALWADAADKRKTSWQA